MPDTVLHGRRETRALEIALAPAPIDRERRNLAEIEPTDRRRAPERRLVVLGDLLEQPVHLVGLRGVLTIKRELRHQDALQLLLREMLTRLLHLAVDEGLSIGHQPLLTEFVRLDDQLKAVGLRPFVELQAQSEMTLPARLILRIELLKLLKDLRIEALRDNATGTAHVTFERLQELPAFISRL